MYHIKASPLKEIWLKASVAGSIWASVEIILGSFLHNLRIPLSGTILSFIGVWILISFMRVWRDYGLVWRAGLICALMKSISPSAIIFGPMIGIFSEALLIELSVLLLGRNLAGYLIGGALAVLSTLVQKVINLIILYGFDLIKILADLYKFGVKQIGLEKLSPETMVLTIASLYLVTGMIGAAGGYISGTRYLKSGRGIGKDDKQVILRQGKQLSSEQLDHNYSVLLLILNIVMLIAIFLLLNFNYLIPAIIIAHIYVAFCFIHYRNSFRRLKKPSFWITFLIITFGAAFLWKGVSQGAFFTNEGLIIGLKMNGRAIVLITGFAAISVELKNPLIKSLLYHRGFASLYQSLNLAFSALPYIISTIRKPGNGNNGSLKVTSPGLLGHAEELLKIFENDHKIRPAVVIITGDVHQGKTSFLQEVIKQAEPLNIKISGFVAEAIFRDSARCGYKLRSLSSAEEKELCSLDKGMNRENIGSWYFNKDAIEFGADLLKPENALKYDLVVIDEIGPLELKGQGWAAAIEKLCNGSGKPQLWVVRKNSLSMVTRKWNTGDVFVFDISESSFSEVLDKVKSLVLKTA